MLQELDATASRRAQPRVWLPAVVWLVEAGLHRRAGATTLAVARDLARRMDYRLGFVLYDLEGTAARCGVSAATVKRHVRVLRELGALVWQRHGTKRNLRLPGRRYAGTATIYAATIPAVYDSAMGHRLAGAGYGARVSGVTDAGRTRAVESAQAKARPVDNSRSGSRGSDGRAPHSSGPHHDLRKADVSGKLNYTSRRRTSSGRVPARSPFRVARDIAIARQVRPLVAWTQHEGLRRLAYALRPLIDRGLGARDIAAELYGMSIGRRPARPAARIIAALAADRVPVGRKGANPTEAFSRAVIDVRESSAESAGSVAPVGADGASYGIGGLTRTEVVRLRSAAATDPGLVLAALENLGERDTRRLYTNRLVDEVLLYEFTGARRGRTDWGRLWA